MQPNIHWIRAAESASRRSAERSQNGGMRGERRPNRRVRGIYATVMAGLVAASLSFAATPALAHTTTQYHESDYATNDHSHVDVYDRECDGHRFKAEVIDASGWHEVWAPPCFSGWTHFDGLNITSWRVCEEFVSCTSWRAS